MGTRNPSSRRTARTAAKVTQHTHTYHHHHHELVPHLPLPLFARPHVPCGRWRRRRLRGRHDDHAAHGAGGQEGADQDGRALAEGILLLVCEVWLTLVSPPPYTQTPLWHQRSRW